VAAILGAGWWRAARQTDRPLIRFSAELSPDAVGGPQMIAILSPDGRRVVFRARSPNGFVLATRLLDQAKATVLSGTEGNSFAFFSPDGQWIGFFAGGKLKKISVQGGTPITLCDSSENYGAAWLTDGTIVFLDGFNLMRVPEAGGTPQRIHTDLTFRRWPQPLPGDDRILLTASPIGTTSFDNAALDVVSLKTLQRKTVLRGGYFGRYLPTGHLLYLHQGTMYGVRFDLSRLETQGAPVPLLEEVKGFPQQGAGHFDFSLTGTLVYESGKPGSAEQPLAWLDSTGVQQRINGVAGISLRLSPDGKRLAFSSNNDLSVYDVERDTTTRITFDPAGINRHPVWTPDGKYLVYAGKGGIWWTRSDGSGQPARILEGDPAPTPWSFAAIDGPRRLRLAFHQNTPDKVRNIWILPLDVSEPDRPAPGKPEVFRATPANEVDPAFSPDGRWLAYTSAESGEPQVYVRPYRPGAAPASGGKWQISNGQGRFPVWARNGKQLFFRNAMGYIMAADYTASGAAFVPGRPREWSSALLYMTGNFQDFDVHPDGKRAVIIALPDFTKGGLVAAHADFLLNFFDDLKRRLP
jgi:Tol biopolymer transport system component